MKHEQTFEIKLVIDDAVQDWQDSIDLAITDSSACLRNDMRAWATGFQRGQADASRILEALKGCTFSPYEADQIKAFIDARTQRIA